MANNELQRISTELATQGYTLTSYDQLGITFDTELAQQLSEIALKGSFSPAAAELTERIEKKKMTMVQDPQALAIGKLLVAPVVEALFKGDEAAIEGWDLYAMNCYQTGGELGPHQDSVEKTVLVVTASGVRQFDVYGKGQTEGSFRDIEASFRLEPGSVMILDAEADPGHAIQCLEGPSVSAVLDVPALLRP